MEELTEQFDLVKNGILLNEFQLQSEKVGLDFEISGVGTMVQLPDALLQEIRLQIQILHWHDNHIVRAATDLFSIMRQELIAVRKRITENSLQIVAVKVTIQSLQKGISVLTKRIDKLNKNMIAITTSLKNIPLKREFLLHVQTNGGSTGTVSRS